MRDNIKMDLGQTGVGNMNLLVLAQDCIQWWLSKQGNLQIS
jgi:hypothetical protein